MSVKTLTPTKLWEGYDPDADKPELSILSSTSRDEVNEMIFAFSAYVGGGKTRVIGRMLRGANKANCPVIVLLGDLDILPVDLILKGGFAIVQCDYKGLYGTKFPEDAAYAANGKEGEHATAKLGADVSAVFLRAKLVRRLLSVMGSLPYLDTARIALAAWDEDCNIAWQTAAMDKRVKALIPFLNFGWYDIRKSDPNLTDDEVIAWDIGCSVQAYLKFIECKVLFVAASNNAKYHYDKLVDSLRVLKPEVEYRIYISPQTDSYLYDCKETVYRFLRAVLVSEKTLIGEPTVEYEIAENKLKIAVKADNTLSDVSEMRLYYACGSEEEPEYRAWNAAQTGLDIGGRGALNIPVYDRKKDIHLFAEVTYKNGVILSSKPRIIAADELESVKTSPVKKRIIYERRIGFFQFAEENSGKFVASTLKLVPGALDILGVSSDNPKLKTYRISEIRGESGESLLQMDFYSETEEGARIGIIDRGGVLYTAEAHTGINREEWQKVQFSLTDFKDSDFKSLKSWDDARCMVVYNADKLLLSNVIWV